MNLKKIHYISGLTITVFVSLHLFNHIYSIFGVGKHIELMTNLRQFYRNIIAETILILAVFVQIISGLRLFFMNRNKVITSFDKLQIWTGLYLAVFFIIHLVAVLVGRTFLNLDTNFYFGVAGLNNFPTNLFFIPYYALAIISFFGHIAAIHNKKMKQNILGLTPNVQSKIILTFGVCLTIAIFCGLTNRFQGVEIPKEYNVLIGK
ncbi:MAG: hypothetical protein ACK5B9_06020 [Flavobacteriia bacterium]|jgi:succinate dehydrogenase/fumarate reductase cytochrome b subunit